MQHQVHPTVTKWSKYTAWDTHPCPPICLVCVLLVVCSRCSLCLCLAGRVCDVSTGERPARKSRPKRLPHSLKRFFFFFLFNFSCHCVAAQQQKNSADTCPCETPCNLTRYGKELSMVKIPSKGSARYLSRKYDKSEDYIRYDDWAPARAVMQHTIKKKKKKKVVGGGHKLRPLACSH